MKISSLIVISFIAVIPAGSIPIALAAGNTAVAGAVTTDAGSVVRAAQENNLTALQQALKAGVDANIADNRGRTPLIMASYGGYEEMVQVLLDAGARPGMVSPATGFCPLHMASMKGHVRVVQRLVAAGADVNVGDKNQVTALHYAASLGYEGVVEALVAGGANLNAVDVGGNTPLILAAQKGNKNIALTLCRAGADATLKNKKGLSASDYADKHHWTDWDKTVSERNAASRSGGADIQAKSFVSDDEDFLMAERYFHGTDGVQKNEAEAIILYRKAAERGIAPAQLMLGVAYVAGRGVAPHLPEAKKWLALAAAQGNEEAKKGLSVVEEAINKLNESVDMAVKHYEQQRYSEAAALWTQAAEKGIPEAQHNLARIYYLGQGVEKSEAEFVHWAGKAAEQGFEPSTQLLAAWKKHKKSSQHATAAKVAMPEGDEFLRRLSVTGMIFPTVQELLQEEVKKLPDQTIPGLKKRVAELPKLYEQYSVAFAEALQANDEKAQKSIREKLFLEEVDVINLLIWFGHSPIIEKIQCEAEKFTLPNAAGKKFDIFWMVWHERVNCGRDVEILQRHGFDFDRSVLILGQQMDFTQYHLYQLQINRNSCREAAASLSTFSNLEKAAVEDLLKKHDDALLWLTKHFAILSELHRLKCVSVENMQRIDKEALSQEAVIIQELNGLKLVCSCVRAYLDGKERELTLHAVAEAGVVDLLKLLIQKGSNVNAINESGSTPLTFASQNGHVEVVKTLLASGAKVDAAEKAGWTSLMFASQNGHAEVVKALLASDAKVDAAGKNGWTSLMLASQNGHAEVVKALLASGAKVNAAEKNGSTSLMIASQNGHVEVVKTLLASSAKVDAAEKAGRTSLMRASQNGHAEVVKALLASGAKVNAAAKAGWTSLIIASQNGHDEVVKVLLASGANVDAVTKAGRTALDIAYKNDRTASANEIIHHILKETPTKQEGRKALLEAADSGHAQAQYQLAYLLNSDKAYEESFKWMNAASGQGYLPARLALPKYYGMGWGVKGDRGKAVKLARDLVNSGCVEAKPVLADALAGQGLSLWLKTSGILIDDGIAASKEANEAIEAILAGKGVKKRRKRKKLNVDDLWEGAYLYFKEAAELGDETGQLFLGRMYAQGNYVKRDKKQARKWFEKAAEQGNEDAVQELNEL